MKSIEDWRSRLAALLLSAFCAAAAANTPCPDRLPERRAWFGDTHIHTRYSQDANWRMGSVQTTPDDAYRFARGDRISLPPYDEQGRSLRALQIQRPLDFAVVTDHAEGMDIVRICEDPGSPSHGAWICRRNQLLVRLAQGLPDWLPGVNVTCADESPECHSAALAVWQDTIDAANRHNDDCQFSAFIGYEWSGTAGGSNLHRNVVFRGEPVIDKPIGALQATHVEDLWAGLDRECRDAKPGCEAITIPHNMNLSQGKMFSALMGNGEPLSTAVALQRARYERLAEILQHKGDSECYYGAEFANDELCNFEKLPYGSFLQKYFEPLREAPANDSRYLREAMREGLRLERKLGINPFVTGFIGSTDTHISAAGAVEENNYQGNHGSQSIIGRGESPQLPDRVEQNPGGLAVLYAEENTREALFAAMQRREAYGTSGPRIQLRFFGADQAFPQDLCERSDLVQRGYALGVPMGGELGSVNIDSPADGSPADGSPADTSLHFVVSAGRDNGSPDFPGTPLQRIQIIKGWIKDDGSSAESVFDLAGNPGNAASVDLASCTPQGEGFTRLCSVWSDPEFDPQQNAFYYARAVENPSCRWQQHICAAQAVDCSNPATISEGLAGCCDDSVPKTIQERAWSSPIWWRRPPR